MIILQFMSLPAIVIFIASLIMMNKLQDVQNRILVENVSSIIAAYNVEKSILSLKGLKANYFLDGRQKWLDDFEKNKKSFNYWYNEAFNSANTDDEKNTLSVMAADFAIYQQYHDRIIDLVKNKKNREAIRLLLNDSTTYYNSIYAGCERLIKINEDLIRDVENNMISYLEKSRILGFLAIASFIALGFILVLIISKSILDPIRQIEKVSTEYAPAAGKKGEIEMLKERFENLIRTINENQKKIVQAERKAAVGEIAAGISHELNNPIGVILGFSELLIKRGDAATPGRELIQDIHSEAVRCKKLLGELLDFARIGDPRYESTNIKTLVRKTVKLFSNQDRYRNVRFDLSMPKYPVRVRVDPMQIKQVIMNLILNACDAINTKGAVAVTVESGEEHVRISIRDSGPGISPELADKIFSPFYTTKPKGVGLGLSICSDLVRKHNGVISVTPGGPGAEFLISLPRNVNE